MVKQMMNHINAEPYCWKWVILALHNVLQGFIVAGHRNAPSNLLYSKGKTPAPLAGLFAR